MSSEPDDAELRDPEEYIQHRRLEDIFDARQKVRDKRTEAQGYAYETGDRTGGASVYRTALVSYLTELEPLTQEYPNTDAWTEPHLGEVFLDPPVEPANNVYSQGHRLQKDGQSHLVSNLPDTVSYRFDGLYSILDVPDPLSYTYEFDSNDPYTAASTITHTVEKQIPWTILQNAHRLANRWVADIGLAADIDTSTDEWDI